MAYPIERKFVIAIASSALFDLKESDKIYREKGIEAYRDFQEKNINVTLKKGIAFPFIRRFLNLNKIFPEQQPVEVVLLSRNSPETGLRVFRSIKAHGLDIIRAAFFSGKSPYKYIPAFNASLFLSANEEDVKNAIKAGYPAGRVLNTHIEDDKNDFELRLAFDFDGVIADDSSEKIYQESHDLQQFHDYETKLSSQPHKPGPLKEIFQKISYFQKLESKLMKKNPAHKKILRISIVTARSAPAHERMIYTLKKWGISIDETFFLGGITKKRVLEILKPHMYFDDQSVHLNKIDNIPLVHVPFGITNKE